jgi:hypothetical protein
METLNPSRKKKRSREAYNRPTSSEPSSQSENVVGNIEHMHICAGCKPLAFASVFAVFLFLSKGWGKLVAGQG